MHDTPPYQPEAVTSQGTSGHSPSGDQAAAADLDVHTSTTAGPEVERGELVVESIEESDGQRRSSLGGIGESPVGGLYQEGMYGNGIGVASVKRIAGGDISPPTTYLNELSIQTNQDIVARSPLRKELNAGPASIHTTSTQAYVAANRRGIRAGVGIHQDPLSRLSQFMTGLKDAKLRKFIEALRGTVECQDTLMAFDREEIEEKNAWIKKAQAWMNDMEDGKASEEGQRRAAEKRAEAAKHRARAAEKELKAVRKAYGIMPGSRKRAPVGRARIRDAAETLARISMCAGAGVLCFLASKGMVAIGS